MPEMFEIEKQDYEKLFEFLAVHWKNDKAYWGNRLKFIWDENPAFNSESKRGIIAKENNQIVGFIGKFPALFQINYEATVSSNGIGLVVDPKYRGAGLGKKLKQAHHDLSQSTLTFATTPNKISVKINKALGFNLLPTGIGELNEFSIVPIRKNKSALFLLWMFRLSKSLKALPNVYAIPQLYLTNILNNVLKKQSSTSEIKDIDIAGPEFDSLWENTSKTYANTNIRNSKTLNWYLNSPVKPDIKLYAKYREDQVTGYILIRFAEFKKIKIALSLDLWVKEKEKTETVFDLIAFSALQAEKNKCNLMAVPHFSVKESSLLNDLGLVKLFGTHRNDLYWMPDDVKKNINTENSYFTYTQGDRFFAKEVL